MIEHHLKHIIAGVKLLLKLSASPSCERTLKGASGGNGWIMVLLVTFSIAFALLGLVAWEDLGTASGESIFKA
jgi:hypothetical protein